jgi:hypothetical protein
LGHNGGEEKLSYRPAQEAEKYGGEWSGEAELKYCGHGKEVRRSFLKKRTKKLLFMSYSLDGS